MKRLIVVMLVMAFLFVAVEVKAAPQIPLWVVAIPVHGATFWGPAAATIGISALVWSPYFYQFYTHPECQKEPSIGDLSNCVQFGPNKKLPEGKKTVFGKEVK